LFTKLKRSTLIIIVIIIIISHQSCKQNACWPIFTCWRY